MPATDVDYRRLRRSSTLVGVADGVVASALLLLAAGTTRDPLAVAGVVAAQHLPWAAMAGLGPGLLGGIDRRTVLGLVHSLRAVAMGLLGFWALAGSGRILPIQGAAVVVGLSEALTDHSEHDATAMLAAGWPGSSTGRRDLRTPGMIGLALVGLPLGGFLYEVVSALPLLLDVPLLALAALTALSVRHRVGPSAAGDPPPVDDPRPPGDFGAITTVAAMSAAASSAVLGVLVLFAIDDLRLGAPAFGLLLAGLAASAAVGGGIAPEVGRLAGPRVGLVVALLAAGGAYVAASAAADPSFPYFSVAALGAGSGASMVAGVLARALLHARGHPVEGPQLRVFHLALWSAIPLGALGGGLAARSFEITGALVGAGGLSVLAALLTAVVPVRGPRPAAASAAR